MKLSRIAISGFKTFARREEIVFESGLTAIVGPNGSGKSNLVDAIRWGLGETNARELRGQRMDEVIYAGGDGRGRMGVAEVEIVLDNEDARIRLDDAEVSVVRRLVRGGEIEYRLNGQRTRLRDVERLLGITGLTQSGYAVVAQNDIDAIIEATPRQRRALVEQAAGVRFIRVACEDALRRVDNADVVVQRLSDRLEECEPHLAQLTVDAEAAREARIHTDRLADLRGSLAREEWRAARAQLRRGRRRLETAQRRLEAATDAESAFLVELGTERDQLDAARAQQRAAAAALESARIDAERGGGEVRRHADRRRNGVLQRAAARLEVAAATRELTEAGLARRELIGSDAGARDREVELTARLAELGAEQRLAEQTAAAAETELDVADRAVAAAMEMNLREQAAARQLTAQLSLFDEAAQTLETEIRAAGERATKLAFVAEALHVRRREALDAVTALGARLERAAAAVSEVRSDVVLAETALGERREVSREALARAASLRGQVAGALGGDGAIAAVARELGAVRLLDAIRVRDPGDAAAIEAALEAHLGAWIVDDVDGAVPHLARSPIREEVLAAGADAPTSSAVAGAGLRPALAGVEVAPRAAAAAWHCLGDIWLAADLVSARAAVARFGGRAVLADGTVVSSAGLRGGGRRGETLELVAAEGVARAAAVAAEEAEHRAAVSLKETRTQLRAVDYESEAASRELAQQRNTLGEVDAAVIAGSAAAEAERVRVSQLRGELARRSEDSRAAAEAAARARADVEEASTAEVAAREEVARARGAVTKRRRERERVEAEIRSIDTELAEIRRIADAAEQRRIEEEQRWRITAQHLAGAQQRVAATEIEIVAAIVRGRAAARAAATAARAVVDAFDALERTAPAVIRADIQVAARETERGEIRVVVARAEDEVAAAQLEVADAGVRVGELAEVMRDEVDDEVSELDTEAAERAEREIVRLERRVAAMGPVNALAIEQLVALEERSAHLRCDRDDLLAATAAIRSLARRLGGEATERFHSVLSTVGTHFAALFGELFPGGRARLGLEEVASSHHESSTLDLRVEETLGVEILAQPAGKRLQPLSHLSGGERAMTSLAMVFALQQVNPSPFYVFDEVDAALDESNVLRFTRLLKRLSSEQQFVVVTHNHVTMAAADALYGVTIDKSGVSSVLSVRFAAAEIPTGDVLGVATSPLRRVAS